MGFFANGYQTTTTGSLTSGATSVTVASTTGIPTLPFTATIAAEGANTDEIVLVTANAAGTLTLVRGYENFAGIGASAHASGATIAATITAGAFLPTFPLDEYPIDATYGDDFSAASLSGSWTRRNFTGGAETYQVGPKATTIRIATASRSAGDGYYRTAPGGDWTIAMKYTILSSSLAAHWGLQVVDTNGTGVGIGIYHGAPTAPLIQSVTTYTTTSGTYYEALYGSSGSPNVTYLSQNQCTFVPIWLYLRKSGTDYYTAFSLDGDAWSPEGGPLAWAGTVDRVAMGMIALAGTSAATSEVIHVDWFNKIA